jgi:hypothetical protein
MSFYWIILRAFQIQRPCIVWESEAQPDSIFLAKYRAAGTYFNMVRTVVLWWA